MDDRLKEIALKAKEQILGAESIQDAEALRIEYLGKKGKLTDILKSMKDHAPEERKSFGQLANQTKAQIESALESRMKELKALARDLQLKAQTIDVTEPGTPASLGTRHLITQTIDEITKIFMSMGFSVSEGPEVETVFNNFDALNAGPNHPARDLTDTFYINDNVLLRTQTSAVQVQPSTVLCAAILSTAATASSYCSFVAKRKSAKNAQVSATAFGTVPPWITPQLQVSPAGSLNFSSSSSL